MNGLPDPRVVDQGVDPSEPIEGLLDDTLGSLGLADIALHREEAGLVAWGDRARGASYYVPLATEGRRQARADSLGRTGDDRDSLSHPTR